MVIFMLCAFCHDKKLIVFIFDSKLEVVTVNVWALLAETGLCQWLNDANLVSVSSEV